jgi:hypothetical protein
MEGSSIKDRFQINLGNDNHYAEVVVREGAAVKQLEPKPPVKTNIEGVIGTPAEYLVKRIETGQFTQERSRLVVNREKISLKLIINEDDEYQIGFITGRLEPHPNFTEFGINTGKMWSPNELGLFFKMNRAFFPDRQTNMKLVSDLMNFTATVNNVLEKGIKESGDSSNIFVQTVNSNLPKSFILKIPVFKGMPAECIEIETFAKVNGREVSFMLISPAANQVVEDIRNNMIDAQLSVIREIAPELAIIEE